MEQIEIVTISKDELGRLIRAAVRDELNEREKRISLLGVKEAAKALKMHPQTVYKLKEKIGYVKHGGGISFDQKDLDQYIRTHRIKSKNQ